jgi:hypothetical protein
MADSAPVPRRGPANWQDAFATMPLEAPPADAWAALADRLPGSTPPRRRLARRVAWRAVAALAVAVAGLLVLRPQPLVGRIDRVAAQVSSLHRPATARVDADTSSADDPQRRQHGEHARPTAVEHPVSTPWSPRRITATSGVRKPPSTRPTAADARIVPVRRDPSVARTVATADGESSAVHDETTTSALARLRTESARLEALAALARDDRMSSAPATILAAEAEDRVQLVDAALSRTDLEPAQQLDLWTRRVAAMRELAGVEGTTRWLAANGESLQGAIALVD